MSIIKDSKNINKVFYGETSIKSIYLGDKAVYNYIPPTPNNLSFEFTGDSCLFYLNGQEFTATTSPYTVDVNTLLKGQPLTSMNFSGSTITKFISIDDTSTINSLVCLFAYCNNLVSVDLSNFNTQNVTTLDCAFGSCSELKNINFASFKTPNLINLRSMFLSTPVVNLDLSMFDVSKVTDFTAMFSGNSTLETINLSNWIVNESADLNGIFENGNPIPLRQIIIKNSDETTRNKVIQAFITKWGDTTDNIQVITE